MSDIFWMTLAIDAPVVLNSRLVIFGLDRGQRP